MKDILGNELLLFDAVIVGSQATGQVKVELGIVVEERDGCPVVRRLNNDLTLRVRKQIINDPERCIYLLTGELPVQVTELQKLFQEGCKL